MSHAEALGAGLARSKTAPGSAAAGYRVEIAADYWRVQSRWERLARAGGALVWQRQAWLSAFYASLGRAQGVEPILATVTDSLSGRDLLGLPLVRARRDGLRIIEFADRGVNDYNAPVVGALVARDLRHAHDIWRAIRQALPAADRIHLARMPASVDGVQNPLALLSRTRASQLFGFQLALPADLTQWRESLERRFLRELVRGWRQFASFEGARFVKLSDPEAALNGILGLSRRQPASIVRPGEPFFLDQAEVRDFYRRLLTEGLASGDVVVTALEAEGSPVAALMAMRQGDGASFVRLATAGGKWRSCSPGRLLFWLTIEELQREGCRTFDFAAGDDPYKRNFGAEPVGLVDVDANLSWRGGSRHLVDLARVFFRQAAAANVGADP